MNRTRVRILVLWMQAHLLDDYYVIPCGMDRNNCRTFEFSFCDVGPNVPLQAHCLNVLVEGIFSNLTNSVKTCPKYQPQLII